MQRYKTYIAIDDTDEVGYHTSTGMICEEILKHIQSHYFKTQPVTRHQLLLHKEVPYTSHNSAMCMIAYLNEDEAQELKLYILDHVLRKSAPSSSPGICIGFEKDFLQKEELVQFGLDAKKKVLTCQNAYEVAGQNSLFLSPLRANEQGVIGALAGVALRFYGNDGRVRGKIIPQKGVMSIKELMGIGYFDAVKVHGGKKVNKNTPVLIQEYLKGVCIQKQIVLLLEDADGFYKPLLKEKLLEY